MHGQIQEMKSFLGLIMVTLIKCLFDICLSFQQYTFGQLSTDFRVAKV